MFLKAHQAWGGNNHALNYEWRELLLPDFSVFNRAVLQNGHYTRSCGIAEHRSGSYVIPGELNLIFSLELTITIYLPTNFYVISPLLISIKSATKM